MERARADPNYLSKIYHEAEQDGDLDDVRMEEEECAEMERQLIQPNTWSDAATKLLICLLNDYKLKLGKSQKNQTKKKMFGLISQDMKKLGYFFTYVQIENKAKGLGKGYKKAIDNNNRTGSARMVCKYHER